MGGSAVGVGVAGGGGGERYDEFGTRFTPFEVYSQEEAFRRTQQEEGIGYAEKVLSYLDDQAHAPGHAAAAPTSVSGLEEGSLSGRERGRERRRHKYSRENSATGGQLPRSGSADQKAADDKRKRSREYTKPEDIKLSPIPKRDPFTGKTIPPSPEAAFLRSVTDFVTSQEMDPHLSQPVWPATAPAAGQMPGLRPPQEDAYRTLERLSPRPPHQQQQWDEAAASSSLRPSPVPPKRRLSHVGLHASEAEQQTAGSAATAPQHSAYGAQKDETGYAAAAGAGSITAPPRQDEPGDKGLPVRLMPDKLMANEEFYEKLRSGLKNLSSAIEGEDATTNYQKYSHHLGRAEFGTLRKKEPSLPLGTSRDPSGDRSRPLANLGPGGSRDPSGERASRPGGGALGISRIPSYASSDRMGKKLSRQGSGASEQPPRSDSRLSDYSGALPDLESQLFDEEDGPLLFSQREEGLPIQPVHRTQSLLVGGAKAARPQIEEPSGDVIQKKEEVLREIAQHKQQIREAKAWIQNGLMTAVGFCVVVYLQSLEMMSSAGP